MDSGRHWTLIFIAGMLGCYSAELDAELYGVYVCEVDEDCALGSACVDGVCGDPAGRTGPILEVVGPVLLEEFPLGEITTIPVTIGGRDLQLTDSTDAGAGEGYVDVLLDGVSVASIRQGRLDEGVFLEIGAPAAPGMHHITAIARDGDGAEYGGDGAIASTAFWMNDGREHVGILRPAPASKIPLASDPQLQIEVASLNFTFANPGFIDPTQVEPTGREGYVRLYVDAGVPGCLPDCNLAYQAALLPAGLSRVNRILANQEVALPQQVGTVQVQIVAQTLTNAPYLRVDGSPSDWVFAVVPIQAVVEIEEEQSP